MDGTLERPIKIGAEGARQCAQSLRQKDRDELVFWECFFCVTLILAKLKLQSHLLKMALFI